MKNILLQCARADFRAMFLTMLFGFLMLPAMAFAAGPFVDIPMDHEFVLALESLKGRGVVKGYPDQTFAPDKTVSRAEFLKMAMVSSGMTVGMTIGSSGPTNTTMGTVAAVVAVTDGTAAGNVAIFFSDVNPSDWFYEFVKTAKEKNLVQGYEDNTFRPHQTVSRVEALKILYKIYDAKAEFDAKETLPGNMAGDVPGDSWFFPFVAAARQRWIVSDFDDGLFRPHVLLTRVLAAEILYRFHTVYREGAAEFDVTTEWDSYNDPAGFSLRIPRGWLTIQESTRTVFWKPDENVQHGGQKDYTFVAPFGAKLVVKYPEVAGGVATAKTAAEYFADVKNFSEKLFGVSEVKFSEVSLFGPALHVIVESRGIENWYIFWNGGGANSGNDNGMMGGGNTAADGPKDGSKVLVVYGEYGKSSLSTKLRGALRGMVRRLEYGGGGGVGLSTEQESLLSTIYENILIEGKGKTSLAILKDAIILETDTIGVGTGPVDYYYSATFNITLKYERASDTILATRDSKTTKF